MRRKDSKCFLLFFLIIGANFLLSGCAPDSEDGFRDDFQTTLIAPEIIAGGLNYPWGLMYIDNTDADGVNNGSVLHNGNILVTNRGTVGQWMNSVVQIDMGSRSVELYSNADRRDRFGESAVDGPMDIAFQGPFVWIANDAAGLGSVAATDPNPSRSPNGPTGNPGDPVDGPTGTGVFGSDDFGFIVLDIFPEEDAEEVPQNTRIEVIFSQPVNPATITKDNFKVDVDYSPMSPDPDDPEGEFAFSSDYTKVEFVYDGYLAEATRYKIKLDSDITDYRGFELDGDLRSPGSDDFESLFTTGSGSPRVIWVNPSDNSSSVPVDTTVEVGFSEPVRESSVTGSSFILLDMEDDKVDVTVSVYPDLTRAVLVPDEQLEINASYRVQVLSKVEDLAGNPLDQIPGGYPDPFESIFSTGAADNNPPFISSINPEDGEQGVNSDAIITITFSEDIDVSSRVGDYFSLEESGAQIQGTLNWISDSELEFSPTTNLGEDSTYMVFISDILTDLVGNNLDGNRDGLAGGNFTSSFSTGWQRLYVTSSYPSNEDVDVSISSYIYINFSKPVNSTTVTSSTFFLVKETSPDDQIAASVWINPGDTGATLKPDADLDEDTRYIIEATSEIVDPAGNPLDQEPGPPLNSFIAIFTTGGEDTTPPCVVNIVPEDHANDVPVSTLVMVQFTEPILPSTITADSFNLTGPSGQEPGEFGFENGNATVSFYPATELLSEETYIVTLTTQIVDSSGNALDGDCDGIAGPNFTSTFTTGSGGIIINEVVVDPQQDWNDSEGGDGNQFNGIPGSGSITTSDEWIEIYNSSTQTFDLLNWTLEMTDTTPEVHIIGSGSGTEVLYPPTSTLRNFTPGSYLIIGNPIGSNNNDTYFLLKNSIGNQVDDVEIGDDPEGDGDDDGAPDPGEDGNADDISNEAIARFPNGFDSDDDQQDFVKQQATIGSDNSGTTGLGLNTGTFKEDVGLLGMSGISAAGFAPDDPSAMNYLYFVSHADRNAVYGIDFDDGAYYVFTDIEGPAGLEFIPFTDSSGETLLGNGYLFILNPLEGNIARIRIVPSGPVGNVNTIAIPDTQGENTHLYLTFPNMDNPVGITYSSQFDRLYAACRGNGLILEFTIDGTLTEIFDTGLGGNALGGIDIANFGEDDMVILTHTGGERVDSGDGPQGAVMYFNPHPSR